MTVTAAIVLFSVVWSMVFFVVLPLRLVTQGDAGEVVPGTHASSPHEFQLGRKARITTVWSVGIWMGLAALILWGPWSVRDLDWFERMRPPLERVD
jgi:predicted secreted protein